MSGNGPLWRAIMWIERFLPDVSFAPAEVDEQTLARRRRRAAWFSLIALFPALMPILVRQRHELDGFVLQNRVAFDQIALVVTGGVIVAVIGFGIRFGVEAWRDAKGFR